MHGRLPYLAAKQKEPRVLVRMAKHQRETIVLRIVRVLSRWESSKFEYEGACRNGLRSGLCLTGQSWAAADKFACEVVDEALHRLAAVRPSWQEGQPDYISEYGRERFYCDRCGRPIPDERYGHGPRVRFCSKLCNIAARAEKARRCGERVSKAEFAARLAAQRKQRIEEQTRPCEQCAKSFTSPDPLKRFCSYPCANAAKVVEDARRICEQCGKTFTQKRWLFSRYCSQRCMGDARTTPRIEQTCTTCGKAFTPDYTYKPAKYCSTACYHKGLVKYAKKPCPVCGTMFKPKNSGTSITRCCSSKCAGALKRAERAAASNSFTCEAVQAE